MDLTIASLVAAIAGLCYFGMMQIGLRYRESVNKQIVQWLVATLSLAMLGAAFGIFPADTQFLDQTALNQPALIIYAVSLMLVFYGVLTMHYLQQPRTAKAFLVIGGIWWLAIVGLSFTTENVQIGSENWVNNLSDSNDNVGLIAIGGWLAIGGFLFLNTFQKFYTARLPELANQALFWGISMPLVILGAVLSATAVEFLREMGWIVLTVGLAGVTYGIITLRVVDIRQTLRAATVNMSLILVTTIVVLVALLVSDELQSEDSVSRAVLLAGLALATGTLHAPIYLVATNLANRLTSQQADNITQEMSRFAQAITGVVELSELTEVVDKTLADVMGIKRSNLLLVTSGVANTLQVEPYAMSSDSPAVKGALRIGDPIYNRFYEERKPLLQFDLDYAQQYKSVATSERQFFNRLNMAAYAPIVVQAKLIGILSCSSKANDTPFSESDLALLTTIANQTGIALRNARLVSDLRQGENDVAETNRHLEVAKRQLEALDAVKTDFITIASHELRTPLAQIRGHTDIIGALNDQGMMDQDQLRGLTTNLRKAADRLETLIGNMLDVSQLDLSAMGFTICPNID